MTARLARAALAVPMALAGLAIGADAAAADPAGPTDYRTEVLAVTLAPAESEASAGSGVPLDLAAQAIDPAELSFAVDILGGDSFVQLVVEPGTEVAVVGYRGEPYLRFGGDGTVEQNERSPSRWLNDDRYGDADLPPRADPDATPDWVVVAGDGTYAWHDHRAHWMNPSRPIGAEPGDTILEAVIPLTVDGEELAIWVRSELLAGPSPVPPLLGAVAAVAGGVGAGWSWRRRSDAAGEQIGSPTVPVALLAVVALWAILATGLGLAAVAGLPGEAAPGSTFWLLPLVAAVVTLGAVVVIVGRLLAPALRPLIGVGALTLAGAELVIWAWLRRSAVSRALIPTQAPDWLDRAVVTGAAATGLLALAAAGYLVTALLAAGGSTTTGPRPAPRPSR